MKDILHKLYFGRVSRCECRANRNAEEDNIEGKINAEIKYFRETLSAEDFKRLDEIENLQAQIRSFEDMRTFNYAFRLGVSLMSAAFFGDETETHDKF